MQDPYADYEFLAHYSRELDRTIAFDLLDPAGNMIDHVERPYYQLPVIWNMALAYKEAIKEINRLEEESEELNSYIKEDIRWWNYLTY